MSRTYIREKKEDKPVLAICYDFDKTLSPDDMQAQGYIQDVWDGDVGEFWASVDELKINNEMDDNLAYMYKMLTEARGRTLFTRSKLEEYGSKVELFPGVDAEGDTENWFERVRKIGEAHGVIVEHYIISSGVKEMIEGTAPARAGAFKKIYASSFLFDETGTAIWPAQAVNYTNKTQFLFRIEKGVLDVNDNEGVNMYFRPDEFRVPFRNMVYIGDSATDIPCMKLVKSYGGHAIGVYNPSAADSSKAKSKVHQMVRDNRINYFAPADYRQGAEMEQLLTKIIKTVAMQDELENVKFACEREALADSTNE